MVYCFVYAPIKRRWAGELLYVARDETAVYMDHVEEVCSKLFYKDKFHTFITEPNAPEQRVSNYLLRREHGMLQRMTASGTYEDLHFDEWCKAVGKHYPELADFGRFLLNV